MDEAKLTIHSSESTARAKGADIVSVEEEFRSREGCEISRLANSTACAESHGSGRGMSCDLKQNLCTTNVR